MAVARDLTGGKNNVIAVIGDGSISAGMAYEAMNNAGAMHSRLIVILNDNNMSIAPPVGAMSAYLARLLSGKTYGSARQSAEESRAQAAEILRGPRTSRRGICTRHGHGRHAVRRARIFYVGPIDGHNLDHLLPVLTNVRDAGNGRF